MFLLLNPPVVQGNTQDTVNLSAQSKLPQCKPVLTLSVKKNKCEKLLIRLKETFELLQFESEGGDRFIPTKTGPITENWGNFCFW